MPEMEVETSTPTEPVISAAVENSSDEKQQKSANDAATAVYDPEFLPDMLPVYYKRLFPHKPFYRWLSYGLCK